MGIRSLIGVGGALTLLSLAALAVGYAPTTFIYTNPSIDTLSIDAKCDGGITLQLSAGFDTPTALAGSNLFDWRTVQRECILIRNS